MIFHDMPVKMIRELLRLGWYDIDRTAPVPAAYFAEIYDEAETIKRLLPQKLKDQYAFKTNVGFFTGRHF